MHERKAPRVPKWLGGCLALALAAPILAHHSVTTEFDTSRVVTINGAVRALELASPHSHLTLEVRLPNGRSESWQTELPSVVFLRRAGWTPNSLRPGDRIQLSGSPSRDNSQRLYATTVIKADGEHLQLVPLCRGDDSRAK